MKYFFLTALMLLFSGMMLSQCNRKILENEPKLFLKQEAVAPLARIFHTDRDEEAAKPDEARQTSILTQGCMSTYRPRHNVSLTQHPSGFSASAVDWYEICGLGASGCMALLGGLRVPLAVWLWLKVEVCWENKKWEEMDHLLEMILQLQPHTIACYTMASWQLAWNASSAAQDEEHARFYMERGRTILEEGIVKNPESSLLYEYLGVLLRDRVHDHEAAAAAFAKAATLHGAHAYLRRFAVYELAASGHEWVAYQQLKALDEEEEMERTPALLALKEKLEKKIHKNGER